jgi:hypothetical protein
VLIHALNQYPLRLIQRHLIVAMIIEASRACGFMIRHALSNLELADVAQLLGDPGRPERVIADLRAGKRGGFAG